MPEILIVDDEPDIRMLVEAILKDEGYEARCAGTSDEALAAYRLRRPDLVILDVWLQGSKLDGIGILEALHQEVPRVPVVMISGHGTIETAVAAIQRGAYDFIEKPFNSDRLLLVVKRALEAARLERENAELRLRVGNDTSLIGTGHGISALRNAIEKVAPSGSRVLISGPPGSGKEVVARMIHAKSRRADGPRADASGPGPARGRAPPAGKIPSLTTAAAAIGGAVNPGSASPFGVFMSSSSGINPDTLATNLGVRQQYSWVGSGRPGPPDRLISLECLTPTSLTEPVRSDTKQQ